MEQDIKGDRYCWEDSPDTLEFYRGVYAQAIAALRPESEDAKTTRNSLLCGSLWIGAYSPICMSGIVWKIFEALKKKVLDEVLG